MIFFKWNIFLFSLVFALSVQAESEPKKQSPPPGYQIHRSIPPQGAKTHKVVPGKGSVPVDSNVGSTAATTGISGPPPSKLQSSTSIPSEAG